MLDYLLKKYTNKKITLIAHNMAYDLSFLQPHLSFAKSTIVKANGHIYTTSGTYYKGKDLLIIDILDSYKMIPAPLSSFGKMFKLDQEKEVMPHDLYTEDNVEKRYVSKKRFYAHIDEKDAKHVKANVEKWGCLVDNKIDIIEYSKRYCEIDCEVLIDGYYKFVELGKEKTDDMSPHNYISLASFADSYYKKEECFEGVKELAGIPRAFIQQSIRGGRTMTRDNKKWIVKKTVNDLDAVSLYPSAQYRLAKELGGYLIDTPKIIEKFEPEKYDGYFVDVKITDVSIGRHFPLVGIRDENDILNYTNEIVGKTITIGKIALEDLVKFQGVKYEFIRGVYFDEGRNDKIGDVVENLFKSRLIEKAEKNPMQGVTKGMLNSAYGKNNTKMCKRKMGICTQK